MSEALRSSQMSRRSPIVALALLATLAFADDTAFRSGLQVGEDVPQFYVRAITGPLKGKSVCYVCRNGDRPVVMVLARQIDPDLRKLLKQLDGTVDARRAVGLRCFGVFVGSEGRPLAPDIQTLAFDEKLDLPLTLAVTSSEGPAGQKLHPDAAVTVVLYRELKVIANFAYRAGELTPEARETVVRQVERLAKGP